MAKRNGLAHSRLPWRRRLPLAVSRRAPLRTQDSTLRSWPECKAVLLRVFEHRPPAPRLLDRRLRELHAASAELVACARQVPAVEEEVRGRQLGRRGGRPTLAKPQNERRRLVPRPHFDPAPASVGRVLDELEL